ncbi:hypothetical protein EON68_01805, partial [archaeon]
MPRPHDSLPGSPRHATHFPNSAHASLVIVACAAAAAAAYPSTIRFFWLAQHEIINNSRAGTRWMRRHGR